MYLRIIWPTTFHPNKSSARTILKFISFQRGSPTHGIYVWHTYTSLKIHMTFFKNPPWMKIYFLLNTQVFQFVMLVCRGGEGSIYGWYMDLYLPKLWYFTNLDFPEIAGDSPWFGDKSVVFSVAIYSDQIWYGWWTPIQVSVSISCDVKWVAQSWPLCLGRVFRRERKAMETWENPPWVY